MNRAPHFALRGLYRQAGAAVGVAARLDESETLAGRLLADLARHALVVPAVLERLAAGVDTATPLQGALARLASGPPPQPAGRPGRGRGADSAEHVARAAGGMLTAKTESARRHRSGTTRAGDSQLPGGALGSDRDARGAANARARWSLGRGHRSGGSGGGGESG